MRLFTADTMDCRLWTRLSLARHIPPRRVGARGCDAMLMNDACVWTRLVAPAVCAMVTVLVRCLWLVVTMDVRCRLVALATMMMAPMSRLPPRSLALRSWRGRTALLQMSSVPPWIACSAIIAHCAVVPAMMMAAVPNIFVARPITAGWVVAGLAVTASKT